MGRSCERDRNVDDPTALRDVGVLPNKKIEMWKNAIWGPGAAIAAGAGLINCSKAGQRTAEGKDHEANAHVRIMPEKFKTTYKHKCRKARAANPLPKIKKKASRHKTTKRNAHVEVNNYGQRTAAANFLHLHMHYILHTYTLYAHISTIACVPPTIQNPIVRIP